VSPRIPLRPGAVGLLAGALVVGGLVFAPTALAASPDVVIDEVYGGGGNSGATLTNDFVELYNHGAAAVDLTGWSVQYTSAAGTTWQVTTLSGSIPAGGSYLVQEAKGAGGTTSLPAADASGSIPMSATGGKVALVRNATPLSCGSSCAAASAVSDFVGFGGANDFEGSAPAPAPSNTASDSRGAKGADTDDNAADFTAGAPSPTNSSGETSGGGSATLPALSCDTPATGPIGAVQGSGDASPVVGDTVVVRGTVVGDLQGGNIDGVDVQDAGDGDDTTSDGIFVFGSKLPALAVGDVVEVRGKVSEFGGQTEVTASAVGVCGHDAARPAPAGLPIPSDDPTRERYEGMLVAPAAPLTVSDVYELDYYGEITLSAGGRLLTPTEAADTGGPAEGVAADNALRSITLDDGSDVTIGAAPRQPSPYLALDDPVRVGDTAQLQPEVLRYAHGLWMLEPSDGSWQGTTFAATNPRPTAAPAVGGDLRIADFNVLNYFVDFPSEHPDARGATDAAQLEKQQNKIVTAIATLNPDVATLHEIENSAVLNPASGEYHAVETLIAALEDQQGLPHGTWNYVKAHEDTDVITNAIIYRTDRVTAVGDPMTPDAADLAPFTNARTPIGQTFHAGDETFSIIANHLKSKGSSCGATSDRPTTEGGNCNGDRVDQARALVDFAQQVQAQSHDQDVLLSGDFNSYRYEDPVDVITGAGFTDMAPVLAAGQYSYVFDGGSGSLDHTFASPSMKAKLTGMGVWDINAPESFAYEYDGDPHLYAPDVYRASDHNPTLLGVSTNVAATAAVSDPTPLRGDRITVTGSGFTAGTTVTATLPARGGQVLGTGVAGPDGTVGISFTVPVLLAQGTYQVQLTAADGEQAATSFTLRSFVQDALAHLWRLLGGGH
jgi:5'-nucleotidase